MKSPQIKLDPLWTKFYYRLSQTERSIRRASKKDYIPLPEVWKTLCRSFQLKKQEAWECLYYLQKKECIKIIPFHGIQLKVNCEVIKR